ncbi:iron ABC transporter permease [Corynebacterium macclintockiae]|uniref:FecCD family ABC transporter permease n=1 Tax=Corynebacterium macclintockiae TaxID=2913501 RepID=UPI00254AE85E|nr:iron ABC transporter permease [Corynebacterium macclintockiae]MDK8891586.1 iron ABC transporter permease [Corynebacterium macclintockiae]
MPNKHKPSAHSGVWLLAIGVIVIALLPVSIIVGAVDISPREAWHAFFAFDPGNTKHLLVREIRMPRTALAIIVGVGLGAAGVVMQAITRNPLAEPGLLGVNSGVTLTVTVAIAFFGYSSLAASMAFGFLGAGLTGALVYALGGVWQGAGPVRLVLAGAAVNVALLASARIILVNSDTDVFDRFRTWTVGSLEGRGTELLLPTGAAVLAGFVIAYTISGALDASVLGHDLSRSLGIKPAVVLSFATAAIIFMCGAVTAAAGPISFVGLTAPFIGRALVGLRHRRLIPATALIASAVVLVADIAGRLVVPSGEIGVGIMASVIGAPVFIAIVRRRKIPQL